MLLLSKWPAEEPNNLQYNALWDFGEAFGEEAPLYRLAL
jgi:hypothetical protein